MGPDSEGLSALVSRRDTGPLDGLIQSELRQGAVISRGARSLGSSVLRCSAEATETERRVVGSGLLDEITIRPDHLEVLVSGALRMNAR